MIHEWPAKKLAVFALLVTLGLVAFMWGIWVLEERIKPVRTTVLGDADDGTFKVEVKEQQPFDLIVYCDEDKFGEAFKAFAKSKKLEGKYPPLIIPGAQLGLVLADHELPDTVQPAKRMARAALRRHAPRRVILVAHSDCLYYDMIGAWRDAPHDEIALAQHDHLIRAKRVINDWLPGTEVEIFYADYRDGTVSFRQMEDELPVPSFEVEGLEVPEGPDNSQQQEKEK